MGPNTYNLNRFPGCFADPENIFSKWSRISWIDPYSGPPGSVGAKNRLPYKRGVSPCWRHGFDFWVRKELRR